MSMTVVDASRPAARVWYTIMVRAILALAWLVWAVLAWWSAPRLADSARLDADLNAGRIPSYATADSWVWPNFWGAPPTTRNFGSGDERILAWTISNGQAFYIIVSGPHFDFSYPSTTLRSPMDDLLKKLGNAKVPYGSWTGPGSATAPLAALLALIGLGVVIGGPDPVRGTRWFWFWFGQIPFGLGFVAWLAWERPWASPPPTPVEKRRSGWLGLGYMIVIGMLAAILVTAARRVLGPWAIPG